jgi:RNA-directed DNA polymerase
MINTKKHLAYTLQVKHSTIEAVILNIDKFYYKKTEIKLNKDGTPKLDKEGNPKKRILYPSTGILKVIQRNIKRKVLAKIPLPDYAYGGVRGRDNIKNAKRHQGKKFIFTTDLKDFFPSISHRMVFEMFRFHKFSPSASRILTQLTTYKGMLPQGAPTSSLIANLIFVATGSKLESFANKSKMTFTSFLDDLTFSSPVNFKDKTGEILEMIKGGKFKISHNKTNFKTRFPVVTGLLVKNNCISVTKDFKRSVEASIKGSSLASLGKFNYLKRVLTSNARK